jgi:hypothetical protein
MFYVPVVDKNQHPMMPTTKTRALQWIRDNKATPFRKRGVFCVRLNVEPSARNVQPIAVGIDPGSKREGYTVKSAAHTFLNIQCATVTHIKDAVDTRRQMRRARRYRHTPCRQPRWSNRYNNSEHRIPPSTKARWLMKLRISQWLSIMFPIAQFVVEDVKATTMPGKGRRWNLNFSPIEVGKKLLYEKLSLIAPVRKMQGFDTYTLRNNLGLKKVKAKLANIFEAHCVDSWVLAHSYTGGGDAPDNKRIMIIEPIRFIRRKLHKLQPGPGGVRIRCGGTHSHGFKRGSIVQHIKRGVMLVGGEDQFGVSLLPISPIKDKKDMRYRSAKVHEITFLTYNSWRFAHLTGA